MAIDRLKILSIHHIGDVQEDDAKISLSPSHIKFVASRDTQKNGRDLKDVQIFFDDGDVQLFRISGLDLMTLENVIAGYSDEF